MVTVLLIVLAVLVGAVITLVALRWRRENERRAALFAFAAARGWDFAVQDQTLSTRWFLEPFGIGTNRRATNVITGTAHGRPVVAFDYAYSSDEVDHDRRTGRLSENTARFSVVVVPMPTYLPLLELAPEVRLDRVRDTTSFAVKDDIDLESDAFNRRFRVRARHRKLASDVLNPRTMEMLLSREPLTLRLDGTDAISVVPGVLDPLDLVRRASTINALLDGIPTFVWRDHGANR